MNNHIICFFVGLFVIVEWNYCEGQTDIKFEEKITPQDRSKSDNLGWTVDTYGEYYVFGVPFSEGVETKSIYNTGTVYVYKKQNKKLILHQKLTAYDANLGFCFGRSVAIHKDVLVVGSPRYIIGDSRKSGETNGAIYIYRLKNNKWEFEKQIVNPKPNNRNNSTFGNRVDVYNDLIITTGGNNNNIVCLIKKNIEWEIADILPVKYPTIQSDVSIFNKEVAISSPSYFDENHLPNNKRGLVSLYTIDENNKLKTNQELYPLPSFNSEFGSKIKLFGNNLIISGRTKNPDQKKGAVYLFERSNRGWKYSTVLNSSEPRIGDWFGNSMDLNNDYIIIGAMGNDLNIDGQISKYQGAVYIFKKNIEGNWDEITKLQAINPVMWDKYGFSVALFDIEIIVGCRFDDEDENERNFIENAGAVYYYSIKE